MLPLSTPWGIAPPEIGVLPAGPGGGWPGDPLGRAQLAKLPHNGTPPVLTVARMRLGDPMHRILLLIVPMTLSAQNYTRGVGVYPGDPAQNFAPTMVADTTTYRNLALHRPAWHSSAYDYNLTAQLVTDGIKQTALPRWVATSTSRQGVLKKNEREWI